MSSPSLHRNHIEIGSALALKIYSRTTFSFTSALATHLQTYLPDPIPTLPLEKDGKKRIMRDMWLEGDVEDSLLALAAELGWLKDLGKFSRKMAPSSRKKLQVALAKADTAKPAIAAISKATAAKSKTTHRRSKKRGVLLETKESESKANQRQSESSAVEMNVSKHSEVKEEMRATVKAVARLVLSGKCRRIAFLTGPGCSVSAGMSFIVHR